MVCLFSYGSSLMFQSITFPSLRSFINAKDRVYHFVPAHGISTLLLHQKGLNRNGQDYYLQGPVSRKLRHIGDIVVNIAEILR